MTGCRLVDQTQISRAAGESTHASLSRVYPLLSCGHFNNGDGRGTTCADDGWAFSYLGMLEAIRFLLVELFLIAAAVAYEQCNISAARGV